MIRLSGKAQVYITGSRLPDGTEDKERRIFLGEIRDLTIEETRASDPEIQRFKDLVYTGQETFKGTITGPVTIGPAMRKIWREQMDKFEAARRWRRLLRRLHVYRADCLTWCGLPYRIDGEPINYMRRLDGTVPAHAGYCARCRAAYRHHRPDPVPLEIPPEVRAQADLPASERWRRDLPSLNPDPALLGPYRDHAAACAECGAVESKTAGAKRCGPGRALLLNACRK